MKAVAEGPPPFPAPCLKPVMTFQSEIITVKTVPADTPSVMKAAALLGKQVERHTRVTVLDEKVHNPVTHREMPHIFVFEACLDYNRTNADVKHSVQSTGHSGFFTSKGVNA